ncbi:TRAP transporter small permease [Halosolutus halophilus]|uniref:TRAP transporter small permease n=1 Tax=Halosolutus halophilus TaxID=1552990 RepID=UPI00223522E4|nr:TRAP transporter small permease [Halosolutus halophilus]
MSTTEPSFSVNGRFRSSVANIIYYLNSNAERVLLLTLYTYIVFIIGTEVFRRFVLNMSSLWGPESARYMFIYLTWIGASWGVNERLHIRIDIIHDYVSERTTGLLYVLGDLMMLIFSVAAIQISIPLIQNSITFGSVSQALRVNLAFFQVAIPFGMSLFVIRILQATYRDVQDIKNGEPVYKGETLFSE